MNYLCMVLPNRDCFVPELENWVSVLQVILGRRDLNLSGGKNDVQHLASNMVLFYISNLSDIPSRDVDHFLRAFSLVLNSENLGPNPVFSRVISFSGILSHDSEDWIRRGT